MKSLPKTIKGINKLLKSREDPHIIGHLENKVDNNDMLKLTQSMTRLAIEKIIFLPTLMRFSPDDVVYLSLPVEIGIEGKSTGNGLFGASVKVKVDVISKLLWDPSKEQIFTAEVSKISMNEIQIKPQKSLADPVKKNMQFMLGTILIDVIHQCTQLVADLLNVSFTSMLNSAAPVGAFEAIQYDLTGSPTVTAKHFLVPYQATFKVSLPGRPPTTTPFLVMPHSGTNLHMVFSKDFISYGIAAMTGGSSATLNKEAGEKWLMTTALANAIPKISKCFPAPQPVVIQTRGSTFPLVSMDNQNIKVEQGLFTEVLVRGQSVLHLEVSITFQAKLSASNGKLFIILSQNSFDILQASSSVGPTNMQKLYDYINDVYTNRFLPVMNGMLRRGIILPSVLNIKWTKLNIALSEGGLVISM
ncbi:BPI fold-containing family B member 4-like [Pituophis catenifer annectens]|uniref:BPI fold-containing family B member 4-like n=1 Tax=Pituophis catenifer annectens TaxID=94852 RepID=UPI0039934DCA